MLHEKLLKGYINDVRPEAEHNQPVKVEFGLVLQGIQELVSDILTQYNKQRDFQNQPFHLKTSKQHLVTNIFLYIY